MSKIEKSAINFMLKATKLNNNKYSYDLDTYLGSRIKMSMHCKLHGIFLQRPADHIQGQQCPLCARNSMVLKLTKTPEKFLKQMQKIYGNTLDFSISDYKFPTNEIEFICPLHGLMRKLPSTLLTGSGCSICNGGVLNTQEFITRSNKIHNNYYLYSSTNYINARSKVTITCPIHGDFEQQASGHLSGRGCTGCAESGYDLNKPGLLYYLFFPTINAYKIGVTNLTINERFMPYEREHFQVIALKHFDSGKRAYALEQWIIKRYSTLKYIGHSPLTCGSTEMFSRDIRRETLQQNGELTL